MKEERNVGVSITIPVSQFNYVLEVSEKENMSYSEAIRWCIRNTMARQRELDHQHQQRLEHEKQHKKKARRILKVIP